jgi:predicted permease
MRPFSAVREALDFLLHRGRAETEMENELRFHLEMETEKNLREGMGPEEARRQAVLAFGGVERVKEEVRDAHGMRPLEDLAMDARFALRHFRRAPLSTAAMILVLMLGIGVNAALFAVLHSVTTLPAPGIPRDPALVRIRGVESTSLVGRVRREMPLSEVREYERHRELFDGVAGWAEGSVALDLGDSDRGAVAATALYVTGNYFPLLRVPLALGAGLPASAEGDDASTVLAAVISHSLWDRYFGGSPDVLGRTLEVDGVPVTIVGVAPPRFGGVDRGRASEPVLWLPLAARPLVRGSRAPALRGDSAFLYAVARLRPGVTAEQAMPTVRAIGSRAAPGAPFGSIRRTDPSAEVVPLLADNARPGFESQLAARTRVFGAATLLILLVTCTNVSGLLVGSAAARRHEIAVRLSLGAGRGRILRQLLTESVLLALAAGILALWVLWVVLGVIGTHFPDLQLVLDARVTAFTSGFALLTGILFGLSPALHATRLAVGEVLKDSAASVSGRRSWLHRGIVVVQVALTQPLLVGLGAVLLLVGGELDARPSRAVYDRIAKLTFSTWSGNASLAQRGEEMNRLVERLAAVPGVLAAVADVEGYSPTELTVPRDDRVPGISYPERLRVRLEYTPRGYLGLMDVPLVRGRDFTPEEQRDENPELIIGEDLARELWGPADPIGRHLRDAGDPATATEWVVVGVAGERTARTTTMGEPRIFVPNRGTPGTVLVRTMGPAAAMLPALRAVASAEAPGLPISSATTLAALEAGQRSSILRVSGAAAAGGLVALLLSAIGLYAVISFAVSRRRREIGIRMAMGARAGQVVGTFFASGLRLSLLGLTIGLPLSLLALRVLAHRVELPQMHTPLLAGTIAAVVVAVAALATWIPARRAAEVDPVVVLRRD